MTFSKLCKDTESRLIDIITLSKLGYNTQNNHGEPPLISAVESGNVTRVEYLLNHYEIEISLSNNLGRSLLHCIVLHIINWFII